MRKLYTEASENYDNSISIYIYTYTYTYMVRDLRYVNNERARYTCIKLCLYYEILLNPCQTMQCVKPCIAIKYEWKIKIDFTIFNYTMYRLYSHTFLARGWGGWISFYLIRCVCYIWIKLRGAAWLVITPIYNKFQQHTHSWNSLYKWDHGRSVLVAVLLR